MLPESYQRFLPHEVRRAAAYPAPGSWFPTTAPPGCIRLNSGYPFAEAVPVAGLHAAAAELLAAEGDLPLMYFGSPSYAELPGLLRARCEARGMAGGALLTTFGSCQALDLAARTLITPADAVAVEAPTYMEALEILRNYTPQILSYPVDENGMVVDALAEDLARRRRTGLVMPKVIYTIATYQNPTGRTLSLERRRALLELADRHDFLILEDDAYGELSFGPPVPTLRALDTTGRVIYLGSLSKTVAPGIRVGWALGPEAVIKHMSLFKKDLENPLSWGITARFLRSIDYPARLHQLRAAYAERCRLMLQHLTEQMPAGTKWTRPEGGFFVWVTLPDGADTGELLSAAIASGVVYVPGKYFYVHPDQGRRHLRLSFSRLPYAEMVRGIELVGQVAMRQLRTGKGRHDHS